MKLSIITINFNNRDGLQKTIDSVISQTWHDYEWIIIDGGSTDGSKDLIEKYQEYFAYWCSEPDKGVYNAMNKGIAKAKGEYLNFMNSGDSYASNEVLEKVFNSGYNTDILYGYMKRLSLDGPLNNQSMMKDKVEWYDFYNDTFPHQSSFIKRLLFKKCGKYDESYKALADWKFFIKTVVYKGASFHFLPIVVAIYECGGISDGRVGLLERDRLRSEMFPSMVMADLPLLVSVKELYARHYFRKMYTLLYKIYKLYHHLF